MPAKAQNLKHANETSASSPVGQLITCLWLNIAVYTIFLIYFRFAFCAADYFSRNLSNVVLIPGLSLLVYTYWRGFRLLQASPHISLPRIVLFGIATSLIALCIPNFYSSDLLSYVNCGWQQAHYHENPYTRLIAGLPGYDKDPMFSGFWVLNPCPYGFLFAHMAKWLCQLGQGNLTVTIWLFKCVNFCAFLALAYLIYFGAKRLKLARPDLSLYLFLFSPMVLLHSLGNGHNDLLMTFFVMLGFFCGANNNFVIAMSALVGGILIKYVWCLALPFFSHYIWRRAGLWTLVRSLAVGSATFFICCFSYLRDWNQFRNDEIEENLAVNANSLPAVFEQLSLTMKHAVFHDHLPKWFSSDLAVLLTVTKFLLIVSFALWAVWLFCRVVQSGRDYSYTRMLEICVLAVLLAVCLISSKFYPWYIVMFFPVALWLPEDSEVRRLALTLSCSQLFAVTLLGHGHINNFLLLTALPLIIFFIRSRKQTQPEAKVT